MTTVTVREASLSEASAIAGIYARALPAKKSGHVGEEPAERVRDARPHRKGHHHCKQRRHHNHTIPTSLPWWWRIPSGLMAAVVDSIVSGRGS
eukprot:TRINITY_DN27629_c0_g1_i1.p1 TRINITY_DN27629_c0_g1~~TRINITY_DN27629_c0_g1_i1.p1  ORF type:complete len:104 (+),score=2.88 TRINITY_DN27629_c0_g1_i1:36-314(+)